jgi:hypothetical protein
MIKLKLDNYVCDLGDASISLVRTSPYPLMASGMDGGNFVFNFSIPATPELKKTLQYAHKPHAFVQAVEVPYQLTVAGLQYSGTAQVAEADRFAYEVFCPVENGDFNAAAKAVKLNEIDLGGDIQLGDAAMAKADLISDLNISHWEEMGFTLEVDLPFPNILINTGELNAAGTIFTAQQARDATFAFFLDCYYRVGGATLKLYKNAAFVEEFGLYNTRNRITHNISLMVGDQVSWKLNLVPDMVPDEYYGHIWSADIRITAGSTFDAVFVHMDPLILEAATQRYPNQNFAVFPVENPYVFDKWPDDFYQIDNESIKLVYEQYFKVINYFVGGNFPATMLYESEEDSFMAGNIFVPFPYLAYLIKRIAYHFNYAILDNPFENELKYAVLINHYVENRFLANDAKMLAPSDSFNLQNHVPDWSVYEFLDQLCKLFGLGYEVNNEIRTITFNYVDDIVKSENYIDISEMLVSDPVVLFEKKIKGYRYKFEVPDNDKQFDEVKSMEGITVLGTVDTLGELPSTGQLNDAYFVNFFDAYMVWGYNPDTYQFGWVIHSRHFVSEVAAGSDHQEVKTSLCPLLQREKADQLLTGRVWTIPSSYQPGRFEGAPDTFQTNWQPSVVWYHGLKNDGSGNPYPFGSAGLKDHAGNTITDVPFALALDGENSIFEIKWKDYLNWRMNAKPVQVKIQPTADFLRSFSFAKKVRFNGSNYLVAEIRGNIMSNGPDVFELTLLLS